MFTQAIVRTPSRSLEKGLTTVDLGRPNYDLALKQHESYIQALKQSGVEVTILPACDEFPDACFVEDVAIVTEKMAIITQPGANSRENEILYIKDALRHFVRDNIIELDSSGTLEGGDVMRVDDHFFIGLSDRTNLAGANKCIEHLNKHGFTGSTVTYDFLLHLKTSASYIGDGIILASRDLVGHPAFQGFTVVAVPKEEAYAANCIRTEQTVLMPAGFPKTHDILTKLGHNILEIDTSEFRKIDGSLTCLSLRL